MAEQRARPARTTTRSRGVTSAEEAAERAAASLSRVIGHRTEGCSEVAPTDDHGWRVCVDVLEVARIPDTTSLLATYEVELAEDGSLRSYRRVRRYWRGSADT
jgi:Gas vesicle synthesis protein GvpO